MGCFRKKQNPCKIEHTLCWIRPKEALFLLDLQQCPVIQSSNGPHLASHKANTQARDNPDLWHPSWAIIIMTVPLQQLLSEQTIHLFMTSPLPPLNHRNTFLPGELLYFIMAAVQNTIIILFYIFLPATQNNTANPRWPLTIACFFMYNTKTHTRIQKIIYCHVVCTKRKDTEKK